MATREQIEKRILSLEDAASHYAGSDAGNGFAQDLDAYRLALAHLDSERARRVGESVLRLVADDSFDAYDLGVEVREIVDAFGGEP